MKYCLIDQPAGIGDIMYCCQIGEIYGNMGFEVIWPVSKQFEWVKEQFITANTNFCTLDDTYPMKELQIGGEIKEPISVPEGIYLPLGKASKNVSKHYPLMLAKYKWRIWNIILENGGKYQ